jgi:predicted amidohydrolase YtcJ
MEWGVNYKDDEIYASMKAFFDQGWQISTHSNGDKAIDQTLASYSKYLLAIPSLKNVVCVWSISPLMLRFK